LSLKLSTIIVLSKAGFKVSVLIIIINPY